METNVNKSGKYYEAVITYNDTTIKTGLLDNDELDNFTYDLLDGFYQALFALPEDKRKAMLETDLFKDIIERCENLEE